MTSERPSELDKLFDLNKDRLEQIAYRLTERAWNTNDFLVVCINVDDPKWRELVDSLMPEHDWQQYRDKGQLPVASSQMLSSK